MAFLDIINTMIPLAGQFSRDSRAQDLYNIMDAREAAPIVQGQQQMGLQQDQLMRKMAQEQALRQLASGGIDMNNPSDFLSRAATITGDTSNLERYALAGSGFNLPATIRVANELGKARQSGDSSRLADLYTAGKLLDKGMYQDANGNVLFAGEGSRMSPASMATPGFNPSAASPTMPQQFPMESLPSLDGMMQPGMAQQPAPMPSASFTVPNVVPQGRTYADAISQLDAQRASAEEQAKLNQQLNLNPQIQTAEQSAKYIQDGFQALPKQKRALDASVRSNENIMRVVGQVRDDARKAFTTGFTGSIAQAVPGSNAYDLRNNLNTLRANAAFTTLQDMRNNSPTGGALGAVSERELDLLEAAYSNVSNSQSYDQFLSNLDAFEKQNQSSLNSIRQAYQEDYNRFGGNRDANLSPPASQQPNMNVNDIRSRLSSAGYSAEQIDQYIRSKGL